MNIRNFFKLDYDLELVFDSSNSKPNRTVVVGNSGKTVFVNFATISNFSYQEFLIAAYDVHLGNLSFDIRKFFLLKACRDAQNRLKLFKPTMQAAFASTCSSIIGLSALAHTPLYLLSMLVTIALLVRLLFILRKFDV